MLFSQIEIRIFFAFGLFSFSAFAATLSGRVVAVADGDTLTVLDARNKQHKVHIAGIDAPDMTQPYGDRSKQHLSELVSDKTVSVEGQKYDRYGHMFAKVMVAARNACPTTQTDCPKTLDIGLAQLAKGLAWQYKHFENEQPPQDRAAYSFAEKIARGRHAGLWADTAPVPPWKWQSDHRLVK